MALWIFFTFFIGFVSDLAAVTLACLPKPRRRRAPVKNPRDPEEMVTNRRVADAASLASPAVLYSQATSAILDPCLRQAWRGRQACRRTRSYLELKMTVFNRTPFVWPMPFWINTAIPRTGLI